MLLWSKFKLYITFSQATTIDAASGTINRNQTEIIISTSDDCK